jgi:hypothetical protein
MFLDLATEAGAADPRGLAAQLALIYDGAVITARMDRTAMPAKTAKSIATTLVDHALTA